MNPRSQSFAMRRREMVRRCDFLASSSNGLCLVDARTYRPSQFQLKEYCMTGEHIRCPLRRHVQQSTFVTMSGSVGQM